VRATDFERVLGAPARARSAHFALHHVAAVPAGGSAPAAGELSTGGAPSAGEPVDESLWLGTVVPKRHAKRAVTRSLLKRQIRAAVQRHAGRLAPGMWVVRLRAPFERARFPSAASDALKREARGELDAMLGHAAASSLR
jgi:ribonuclease P protein component